MDNIDLEQQKKLQLIKALRRFQEHQQDLMSQHNIQPYIQTPIPMLTEEDLQNKEEKVRQLLGDESKRMQKYQQVERVPMSILSEEDATKNVDDILRSQYNERFNKLRGIIK